MIGAGDGTAGRFDSSPPARSAQGEATTLAKAAARGWQQKAVS